MGNFIFLEAGEDKGIVLPQSPAVIALCMLLSDKCRTFVLKERYKNCNAPFSVKQTPKHAGTCELLMNMTF